MEATKQQKQLIHVNSPTRDIKEEFVQWATGDVEKISCNDLDFDQANMILEQLGMPPHRRQGDKETALYGKFDKKNRQHMYVLSLLRQMGWTKASERYGQIADIYRFGEWLQSERAPVRKPLLKMTNPELTKTINALESMLGKKWKK